MLWNGCSASGGMGRMGISENQEAMGNRFEKPVYKVSLIGILSVLAIVVSLYGANEVASWFVPPFPIIGLHGVKPEWGIRGWGRVLQVQGGQGFNDWGQRDRQRDVQPPKHVKRIAFVGDSFVEESAPIPIPMAVENKLGRKDVEVVNFGVSATGVADYYYRIKNVVIPLGAHAVFLFFYVGNDFVPDKHSTRLAIFTTYPKDSIASRMGLLALNHLVTNRHRNVLRVWQVDQETTLHQQEQEMMHRLQTLSDAEARQFLLDYSKFSGEKRDKLEKVLQRPENTALLATLRHPDGGLFRSYMFDDLFRLAVGESLKIDAASPDTMVTGIYPDILAIKRVCDAAQVALTVLFVPMGLHVDPRYVETWSLFGDLDRLGHRQSRATELLRERLIRDGIAFHDLNPVLKGVRGAYLNVDGHWSQQGVDWVADDLSRLIRATLP
ncbi:MAG: SGNH/GDSL hydrolase family protein [Magnetococcales bacterium]|nr:SGNH/GDSL hydrolase family protein [Magnetococcales bacterium]